MNSITGLLALGLWFFGIIGWVLNIIQIAQSDHITGMIVVRIIGVFMAPLGAVLGWF